MKIKKVHKKLLAIVEDPINPLEQIKNLIKEIEDSKKNRVTKESITEDIINSVKYIFEAYPTLDYLPIYAWGRYHKYELRGDSFEMDLYEYDQGLSGLYENIENKKDQRYTLLCKIDEDEEIDKGYIYTPTRKQAVKFWDFDGGGGKCLVVVRQGEIYSIEDIDCDRRITNKENIKMKNILVLTEKDRNKHPIKSKPNFGHFYTSIEDWELKDLIVYVNNNNNTVEVLKDRGNTSLQEIESIISAYNGKSNA